MKLNYVWSINLQSFLREVENGEEGKEDRREGAGFKYEIITVKS